MMSETVIYPEEISALTFLFSQNEDTITEFCKVIAQVIKSGEKVNPSLYNSAAKKLGISPRKVSNALSCTAGFLSRSCLAKESPDQLREAFKQNAFDAKKVELLLQIYYPSESIDSSSLLEVKSLQAIDWRIDVIAATRSVSNIAEPLVTLHLHTQTKEMDDTTPIALQTDVRTLQHVSSVLEEALQHARSRHHARIQALMS